MYVTELDLLAGQERYHDLLEDAEKARLIQAAGLRPLNASRLYRKAADWVGAQFVQLGCALASPAAVPACRVQLPA